MKNPIDITPSLKIFANAIYNDIHKYVEEHEVEFSEWMLSSKVVSAKPLKVGGAENERIE